MKIKALKAVTVRDGSTGELTSFAHGEIATVSDTLGNQLIADGLAEEYLYIIPTGSKSVTANGEYDVTDKASVNVNVPVVTITYNANGGTGTVAAQAAAAGSSVELSDGTGLTAPEGKEFIGWATTNNAETPDVTSPYTAVSNITLYAVYAAVSG